MNKLRLGVSFMSLFFLSSAFAETCPSITAIKNKQAKDWQAYDSDDGKKLSLTRETQFTQNIEAFVLAEYIKKKQDTTIHCYYRNKTGSTLEAYLAKNNFAPTQHHPWYEVTGALHCAASQEQCGFEASSLPQQHLAARR